jgi:hypothetical protein
VKGCTDCNQNKKATVSARHPMLSYHSGSPMERVHLDFIGPLPRTERGNEHILMMVDQFTKWVECIPLPSQSAEVTARAAVNQFFSRFGCTFHVFTDVFPGPPNISFAVNPISLPSIIILGVYPVLLFTEDLNAPSNCGRY